MANSARTNTRQAIKEDLVFKPQPGPQTEYLSTEADICIFGGSAGGGKTYGTILETLRHVNTPGFRAVIIRRKREDIKQQGGIWDDTEGIYPAFGGQPNLSELVWYFPEGATVGFGHMNDGEKDHKRYKSAAIALIVFEELTEFMEHQFWYMLSRNRSTCGVRPYIRATTNPEPGWVADLLMAGGYVCEESGYAIDEMSGVVQYIVRDEDELFWFKTRQAAIDHFPDKKVKPLSFTFIRSSLEDNQALLEIDPDYEAKLSMLTRIERERLLKGNWKIKPSAGLYFKPHWFHRTPRTPLKSEIRSITRYWDRASTAPKKPTDDPDWTVGILMAKRKDKTFVILDMVRFRGSPADVEKKIKATALEDDKFIRTLVSLEQDPGQAGVVEIARYAKELAGHHVKAFKVVKDKKTRANPVSSAVENGLVTVIEGHWNQKFMDETEQFPEAAHDDIVDALSGAFTALTAKRSGFVYD